MKGFILVVLCLCVVRGYGSLCTDLTGTWKNQLNSNMTIEDGAGSSFTGSYHTAVESTRGAATFSSKISGLLKSVEHGKLIGFNVLWNKGASLTAWVGQCVVCDGQEKIFTTWVLRSYLPAKKRWMTTRINQDTFWRLDAPEETVNQITASTPTENEISESEMQGRWVSSTGDSFEISQFPSLGSWTGIHKENNENHHHDSHEGNLVVGRFDGNQTYTAIGLVSTGNNKIRGWTGHMDNAEETKAIETSWLEHTFQNGCNNPRKLVKFGMENYSKV